MAALQHQALALRAAGDVAGACRLLADALNPLRASYGEDHPDVLGSAHLLARLHREADDPAAARRVLEEAIAAGERRWNPSDPLMLAFSFDLASVAEELGNRHEARRHYSRVASSGPAVLGVDHPAVQAARHYLGGAAVGTAQPVPPLPHESAMPLAPVSTPPRQLPP
ncbi:tetratricopeptide repeat protein, partial [Micromonospora sp. KC207]